MKKFETPGWDHNKQGEKASKAFEQVKTKNRKRNRSGNKGKSVSPVKVEKIAPTSKNIKKKKEIVKKPNIAKASPKITIKKENKSGTPTKTKAGTQGKDTKSNLKAVKGNVKKALSPKATPNKQQASKNKRRKSKTPQTSPQSTKQAQKSPNKSNVNGVTPAAKKSRAKRANKKNAAKGTPQKAIQGNAKNQSPQKTPQGTPKKKGKASGKSKKAQTNAKKLPQKTPVKSPQKSVVKTPGGKSPRKSGGKSPQKSAGKSPQKSAGTSPQKPRGKSPQKAGGKSPQKPVGKSPQKAVTKSPTKSAQKSPKKKTSPQKLSPTSVTIKKRRSKEIKRKIKVAGLLGNKGKKIKLEANEPAAAANTTPNGKENSSTPANKKRSRAPKLLNGTANKLNSHADRKQAKLALKVAATMKAVAKREQKPPSLHARMKGKLLAARFRFLNEELYTRDSSDAALLFREDPDAFGAYHEGYRAQVKKWPLNPLAKIVDAVRKMPEGVVVADFGCGDAELARSVKQKVHSFDLVASADDVVACDMASVPLEDAAVDVAVFCLSLMGTNLHDYLIEANRVLKIGGILKIAEVESRFEKVDTFVAGVRRFGFENTFTDLNHNLFYFLDFKKTRDLKSKKNLPTVSLKPCVYKRR